MNYPADSTAKLCQGGKGQYVGREGVPVDNCSREKCEPVKSLRAWICLYAKGCVCRDVLVFRTR